jgi:hypothetical protein
MMIRRLAVVSRANDKHRTVKLYDVLVTYSIASPESKPYNLLIYMEYMVGTAGFEPTTSTV